MSYQDELQRLVEAKASMRQSIINKGVEVPDDAKIEEYADYIRQIEGGGSWDPSNPDLDALIAAIRSGQDIPVGSEAPDKWDDGDAPVIVAQKLDSTNNQNYGGADGYILIRKYAAPLAPFTFGTSVNYETSAIRTYLETTYLDKCSSSIKSALSKIKIPYYNGSSMLQIESGFFLMGIGEVCGDYTSEGIIWDYWKNVTGLAAPGRGANQGRIPRSSTGAVQYVWLRSRLGDSYVGGIAYDGSIIQVVPSNTAVGIFPAFFIAKGGN